MRVLVVNPPLTAMLNLEHLTSRGIKPFSCRTAEEALSIMDSEHIDLVVTFISYSEPNIFNIVKAISEFSEFVTSMEDFELIPAKAGALDWSYKLF